MIAGTESFHTRLSANRPLEEVLIQVSAMNERIDTIC